MAEIRIEGQPTDQIVPDHLYLVFVDDSGDEFVIRGGRDNEDRYGTGWLLKPIYVEEGEAIDRSADSRTIEQRAEFGSRVLDLGGRDANDVWQSMLRSAELIADTRIPYTLDSNSNSTVAAVLRDVGIDVAQTMPYL